MDRVRRQVPQTRRWPSLDNRHNLVEDLKPWRARAPLKTANVLAMHNYYMQEMNPATLKVRMCCLWADDTQSSVLGPDFSAIFSPLHATS